MGERQAFNVVQIHQIFDYMNALCLCGRFRINVKDMAKHNKESGGRNYPTEKRKLKQVGTDLWNELDLATGLFYVVQ